jgi:hypothetical protein
MSKNKMRYERDACNGCDGDVVMVRAVGGKVGRSPVYEANQKKNPQYRSYLSLYPSLMLSAALFANGQLSASYFRQDLPFRFHK